MFARALLLAALQLGSISVTVVDETGTILPGSAVDVLDSVGTLRTGLANEEGVVALEKLIPGEARVRAKLEGFIERDALVTVVAGRSQMVKIELRVAPVTETVDIVRSKVVWPSCSDQPRVDDLP